jgi:hypothetical protein
VQAIKAYEADYSRLPVSSSLLMAAAGGDVTCGGGALGASSYAAPLNPPNSEVVDILMDKDTASNPNGSNLNHVKNTKRTKYLSAKDVGDNTRPGVGPDGVYRDPWGTPYIISLDLNFDENTRDSMYKLTSVSDLRNQSKVGYNGLVSGGAGNDFEFSGNAMVWSLGPDGKFSGSVNAKTGVNKDNILSWAQ